MKVKVNTSDTKWIARRAVDEPVAHGTDVKGAMYFSATIEVPNVEHVTFAGAKMIRFDIGKDAPRDHNRYAMYPATYLVG
jgi:hypothetical protein